MCRAIISLVIWVLLLLTPSSGMIGYECGSSSSNITTLSLLEVDECEISLPTLNISTVHVQLIQINEYGSVHVHQCKVEIDRSVRKCGMFSHTSDVTNGKASYIFEVSKDVCMKMHETGSFRMDRESIMGIENNQTQYYSVTLAGSVGVDGACSGASYADPFGSWDEVVVLATVKITLRDYYASIGLKTDKVYLKSGVRCDLSKGQCMDMEGGHSFWNSVPMDSCGGREYGVLHIGLAEKVVDKDSEILYTVTTSDIIFALVVHSTISICGQTLIRSEHPRLLVHEVKNGQMFLQKKRIDAVNMDIYAYVNSKFVYVERHVHTQTQQLYIDLLTHKCELEREMLKNRLAIAVQAPDEFAYHLMKGPGYMAVISGEVVHVIKCVPTEVKIRHLNECYTHLPVTRGNISYFLAPKTHILMGTGLQITCNRLVPPMYFIDEEWYGMMPGPTLVYPPETMKPNTKPTWKYSKTKSLATSGIYTSEELEQLREHIMFPAERPAMLNSVVRRMSGKPTIQQGGSFIKLLKGPELEQLIETAWNKLWDNLIIFGHISAGLIGIIMIIRTIKLIIDTIIHGYALHTVYGWSIFLLGAVWDSVTGLLLHLKNRSASKESENLVRIKKMKEKDVEAGEIDNKQENKSDEENEREKELENEEKNEDNTKGIQTEEKKPKPIYPQLSK